MTITMSGKDGQDIHTVNTKEDFMNVVSEMYDKMKQQLSEERKTEKEFWYDFLLDTPFETKRDFDRWMGIMDDNEFLSPNPDFEKFRERTIEEALNYTEYSSIDEMINRIEELEGIINDIHEQSRI